MDENDEQTRYEQIQSFLATFSYEYIDGITYEIKESFFRLQTEGAKAVKEFALFFDYATNHYRVTVTLEDFTLPTIDHTFFALLTFIAYTGATITTSKKTAQGMRYILASLPEQGSGFYCEVDFLRAVADLPTERVVVPTAGDPPSAWGQRPAVKWRFKLASTSYLPLCAAQDLLYIVDDAGDLSALDVEQGSVRWHWQAVQPPGKITAPPVGESDVLVVYTSTRSQSDPYDATLSALDARTGRTRWSAPVPALQTVGSCHLLTAHDGTVYLSGTERNRLLAAPRSRCLAIDLQTGRQQWSVEVDDHMGTTTPVVARDHVYLASFDLQHATPLKGYLHALNAQTGVASWQHTFETNDVQEILVDRTDLFVPGTTVEVLDALTGATRWSLSQAQTLQQGSLAIDDELLYISYTRLPAGQEQSAASKPQERLLTGGPARIAEVMAVERANGQSRWVTSLTHGLVVSARPVLAGNLLYTTWKHLDARSFVTHAILFALDAHTGQERWRFKTNDLSAPLAVDGTVYIRAQEDDDDYIYALV